VNDIFELNKVSDHEAAHLVSEDAFAELADQITAQSQATGGRGWKSAWLPVAAAVTAAVLATGAILAVHDDPARSGANPAPSPVVRPATTAPALPPPARPATTAAQLVAYATRNAAAEVFDPQPRQWLFTNVLELIPVANAPGHGHVVVDPRLKPFRAQTWQEVDGQGFAALVGGKLDRNIAGGVFAHGVSVFGWPRLSYSYLESLPSSPARLTAIIEANLKAQNKSRALPQGVIPADAGIADFEAVQTLLQNVVVLPPRLQAGLYGVLARDPAVRFQRSVTDYSGRTGAGFSASLDNGNTENLIVVNTRTYAYMGIKQVALKAFTSAGLDGIYRYHKGAVLDNQAVLSAGIVKHPGERP
jgi:hypothetical protein